MAFRLQGWIHKLEEGAGTRVVLSLLALMVVLFAGVFFNFTQFRNLDSAEGMDQAQLARNLSRGRGFETSLIRPLSLNLVFRKATNVLERVEDSEADAASAAAQKEKEDYWLALLQDHPPDLANAPLYPLLLAGALKLNPLGAPSLIGDDQAEAYPPDRWIALCNQFLFLVAVWMTYCLGRSWFDAPVGWLAAGVMVVSEPLWRWTLSGQSIMLQLVLVLGMLQVVGGMERSARDEQEPGKGLMRGALLAGVFLGLLGLTRYSLLFLVAPVTVLLGTLPTPRRARLVGTCLLVCLVFVGPWILRNYHLSGTPFGTAGYALFEDTTSFPGDTLERSVNPDFREFSPAELKTKLFRNLPRFLERELPRLGGSWITAFFLAGLLVPFRSPRLSRMRNLLLVTLVGAVLVQSLAAPAIFSSDTAKYADPVLVSFAPLVFVFGASLFLTLYRQLAARAPGIRFEVLGSLCLLLALPLLLHFLHPVRSQLAFPPYYPRWIQEKAALLEETDWCMSDIPGAMAWYGDRPSVLWPDLYKSPGTGRYPNDFFEIHQRFKAIRGLYLSSAAMNEVQTEPLIEWIARTDESAWENTVFDWEAFILVGILLKNEVPQDFPLKNAPFGIYPELFLVDSERIEGKSIQTP